MGDMRWASPERLALLWLLPVAIALLLWAVRSRRRDEAALGDPTLLRRLWGSPGPWGVSLRAALSIAALAAAVLGVARPQAGLRLVSTTNSGPDVAIALDLSTSMRARDIRPDRLSAAQREIAALLAPLEGSAIGLIGFAGESRVLSPLTTDLEGLRDRIDAAAPEDMDVPGSDVAGGVALAAQLLRRPGDRPKVIVLVTDGEQLEGDPARGLPVVKAAGATLIVIGMGTPEGGAIPIVDSTGAIVNVKRDREGREVRTRLDEEGLRRLARTAGGRYERGDGSGRAGRRAASLARGQEPGRADSGGRSLRAYDERFHWLAATAVLLLIGESLVPRRRRDA